MHLKAENNRVWYDAHMERFLPKYAVFSYIACFALNGLIYWATQFIMSGAYHYDLTTSFDKMIPFVPQWIIIYVLTYFFWIINYSIIAINSSKKKWFMFVTADMITRLVCGVFFILLPTTNIRPEIVGGGFSNWLTSLIYSMDKPFNLFPSIHCLASWMCYIGMRKIKSIPKWYRIATMVFALLICASTQFTKQHYIFDVISGLMIAEICYYVCTHTSWYKKVMGLFDKVTGMTFGIMKD